MLIFRKSGSGSGRIWKIGIRYIPTINRIGPHRTAVVVLIHVMVISGPLRSGTVNSHTGCNGLITRSAWLVVVQRQLGGHMKFIEPYSITVTVTPTLTLKLTVSLILTLT